MGPGHPVAMYVQLFKQVCNYIIYSKHESSGPACPLSPGELGGSGTSSQPRWLSVTAWLGSSISLHVKEILTCICDECV